MTAINSLRQFVESALLPDKARRYFALLETKKGLLKIADDLCHGLESEIDARLTTTRGKMPMSSPCFVFKAPHDMGTPYKTMAEAYATLAASDSWLIVAEDGMAGIHRPENRWDAEKMIRIEPAGCRQPGSRTG
jgi:hypothetical protein